jgi:cephalosporin hydroxylase
MKFSEYTITDKNTSHDYGQRFYDKLLEPYLDKQINLLELGVQYGPSILAWAKVLKNAQIYGIDINLGLNKYKEEQDATGRVHLFEMNLYSENTAQLAEENLGKTKFDIIIDDADHGAQSQAYAFKIFYPRLKMGGTYVIEDCRDHEHMWTLGMIEPVVGPGTIEIIDLRQFKNRLNDDILIVVKKYPRLMLL